MTTYYIYNIPGIKIGCTTQPHKRIINQQKFSNYEILEEHDDIFIASNREQELQKQYGYKIDKVPYWQAYKKAASRRKKLTKQMMIDNGKKSGKIGGKIAFENKIGFFGMSKEKLKEVKISGGKAASIINKINGVGIYGITKEQRMENCKKASKVTAKPILAFDKFTGNFISEFESAREASRQLNLYPQNIASVLKGKYNHTKGYTFKYKVI
jgi:hypothetical protein